MKSNVFLKVFLVLIFTVFFVHLVKDITQDILQISTPLDYLGNAQEDLSMFPSTIKLVFTIFGYISVIAEIFIIAFIALFIKDGSKIYLLKPIFSILILMLIYFLSATLLDPRFNPWLKISSPNLSLDSEKLITRNLIISTDNAATTNLYGYFAAEPDDSLALAVLLNAHRKGKVNIFGITSTFGNTNGETTYRITKKQIELSGLNVPVKKGAVIARQTDSEAVAFIADTLKNSKEKVVLVALGPVTDYAAVFKKYPELKEKVEYFFLVRSGPYLNKNRWFLFSYNSYPDVDSSIFMYGFGANQFRMGKEIFSISIANSMVNRIQQINNPMIQFISSDLKKWNAQNKFFPIKGYFSRRGNMCPWDLVWSMYLIEPKLFSLEKEPDSFSLHIKDKQKLIESAEKYLSNW